MFVKFFEILMHDQKLPELMNELIVIQLNWILNPSFIFVQAIQNETSTKRSHFLRG